MKILSSHYLDFTETNRAIGMVRIQISEKIGSSIFAVDAQNKGAYLSFVAKETWNYTVNKFVLNSKTINILSHV